MKSGHSIRISRCERGFGLIEAMMAIGVLAVGGYFAASLLRTGAVGQKTILAQDDARVLTDNMASLLSDPTACKNTFLDMDPTSGATVTTIRDKSNNSTFVVGQKYGNRGVTLDGITLGGSGMDAKTQIPLWSPTSAGNTGTAFVRVDWLQTGTGENVQGPAHLIRFFLVQVTSMSASKIQACTSQSGGGGTNYWSMNSDGDIYNNNAHGAGNVGIGTNAPVTTLDIKGTARLLVQQAEPFSCDGPHDGALALNKNHQLCVCNGTAGKWVLPDDGNSTCSFSGGLSCVPSGGSCTAPGSSCCTGLMCDASGTCKVTGGSYVLQLLPFLYDPNLVQCATYGWGETAGSPCNQPGVKCITSAHGGQEFSCQ